MTMQIIEQIPKLEPRAADAHKGDFGKVCIIAGSIGIAPSINLNPEGKYPSMFEPVHGSAPDIAGTGVANPAGQIWSGAMMLDHLGFPESGKLVMDAMESTFMSGISTPDLGGNANTTEVTDSICREIRRLSSNG